MKLFGYLLAGALAIVALFYAFNAYIYNEKQADESATPTSEDIGPLTLEGIITDVNVDGLALDGPTLITFKTEVGESHVIAVPSMGIQLCAAAREIMSPSIAAVGDRVAVRGAFNIDDETIVPCDDTSHYLRITGSVRNSALGIAFEYPKGEAGYQLQDDIPGMSVDPDFRIGYMLTLERDIRAILVSDEPREGAPTIQIRVYENTEKLWPAVWAMRHPLESNIELAFGEPEEVTVGGAKAVKYTADGLYASTVYIVTNGSYVYVLTGAYMSTDDDIKKDFDRLVSSLIFTEGL